MQVKPRKAKPLRAKPSRIHVDYERIIGKAIQAIPEPIKGDKGDAGESIVGPKGIKGTKGDSIRGPQGIKGEKGDSVQGERGLRGKIGEKGGKGIQGLRGPRGKDGKSAEVDYERIFGDLRKSISKERSLVDLSIKKKGSGTLVITKLYRDGSKKTESITIQTGGGGGGGSAVRVDPTTVTADFNVSGTVESYNANSAIPITGTLPASPTAGEFHYITNVGAGDLTISSAKTVAGLETTIKQYEGLTIEFSEDLNMWTVK